MVIFLIDKSLVLFPHNSTWMRFSFELNIMLDFYVTYFIPCIDAL